MKRFISIFSCLMFLLLSATNYYSYKMQTHDELLNSSKVFNYEFNIPDDSFNSNPKLLEYLKKAATDNNVNLIRKISYYNEEKKKSYNTDYVFLTTNTNLFNTIDIKKGREISHKDMKNSAAFLSTEDTKNPEQLGIIKDFGGDNNFSIRVLDSALSQYKYAGNYAVECNSKNDFLKFIDDYVNYVKPTNPNINVSKDMIVNVTDSNMNQQKVDSDINFIGVFIFFLLIITLVLIFYLVSQTKAISVMKMNGFTTKEISIEILIRDYIKIFLITNFIILLSMFLIPNNNMDFIIQTFAINIFAFIITIVILIFICIFYIHYTKITYCIKGKKPIGPILFLNIIFKVAVSVIVLVLATNLVDELNIISLKQENLSNWKSAANYGGFYPIRSGNDQDAIRSGGHPLDVPSSNLYTFLNNEMYSLYIYSDSYTTDSLETNVDSRHINFIVVNPNYLKKYPVYDENNKPITIKEDTKYQIYLVPEQYKDNEKYLKDYFIDHREQRNDLHTNYYNQKPRKETEEVVFIYTKSGQNIFSFNTDVYPENNNLILDPIISVMTNANSLVPDRIFFAGENINLFVPLIDMNAELTYSKLLGKLKEYNLDDNFPYFVKINDVILQDINNLEEEATVKKYLLLGVFIVLLTTILQYIYLLFQKNKFEFFLKKTFGHNFIQKYKNLYLTLIITNSFEFLICYIFILDKFNYIFIFKFMLEILIMSILILFFEKRNNSKILKEGI